MLNSIVEFLSVSGHGPLCQVTQSSWSCCVQGGQVQLSGTVRSSGGSTAPWKTPLGIHAETGRCIDEGPYREQCWQVLAEVGSRVPESPFENAGVVLRSLISTQVHTYEEGRQAQDCRRDKAFR